MLKKANLKVSKNYLYYYSFLQKMQNIIYDMIKKTCNKNILINTQIQVKQVQYMQ